MIRSMTGYGDATRRGGGLEVQVEIKSVNNRFFDFHARLSRELSFLEGEVMNRTRETLGRGRVTVTIGLERGAVDGPALVDPARLDSYIAVLRQVEKAGKLFRGTAAQLLTVPGLLEGSSQLPDREQLRSLVMGALDEAINGIMAMKEKEGLALAADLDACLGRLRGSLDKVRAEVPLLRDAMQTSLRSRLEDLLADVPLDEQRLAQEAAILVDRGDVSEEIARLDSHLVQFSETVAAGGETGKRLGFILQEILREANTIGSKTQGLEITAEVLLIKEETEKLREQILNLE